MEDDCLPNEIRTLMDCQINGSTVEVVGRNRNGDMMLLEAEVSNVVNYGILRVIQSMKKSDEIYIETSEREMYGEITSVEDDRKFADWKNSEFDFDIVTDGKDKPPMIVAEDGKEVITAVEITSRAQREYRDEENGVNFPISNNSNDG